MTIFCCFRKIDIRKFEYSKYSITMVVFFLFPDDRRLLSYKPVVAKHCPNRHLRSGPPADGRDSVCRFLEVSRSPFPSYRFTGRTISRRGAIRQKFLRGRAVDGHFSQ